MSIGITVTTTETPQPATTAASTGTLFLVGVTTSGPTGVSQVQQLSDYTTIYGARDVTGAVLYDSVDTFFREGGQKCYVVSIGASGADAAYVTGLNLFTPDLGPGQVAIPGKTSTTIANGLAAHAGANNRVGLYDVGASGTAASLVTALGTPASFPDRVIPIAGQAVVPGLTPGTTRNVPGSAVIGALCARAAAAGNDNVWPCGQRFPLRYVTNFTAAYSASTLAGCQVFTDSDLTTLNNAGINVFANRYGTLCLFGLTTAQPQSQDLIFWSGSASRERMALVQAAKNLAEPYLFQTLDGQNSTLTAFAGDLRGLVAAHWQAGALFGNTAVDAGSVNVAAPVNTATTEQAGQLNAVLNVRISPIAETVAITINFAPITTTV